jgi:hypothetical protein
MIFSVCALALLFAVASGPAAAAAPMEASLAQDFHGAQCDSANWKFLDPAGLTRPETAGLLIEIPASAGAIASAGVAARFGLRGDFEITADFELVDVPTPKSGFGAGATISIAGADGQGASMQRVRFPDGNEAYVCHRATPQPDGTITHTVEVVPTTASSGSMRIARRGSDLSYSTAEGGAGDFRELHKAAFSDADLRLLHLAAQTGEAPSAVSVRWTKFQAKAEQLLGEDGMPPGNRPLLAVAALTAIGLFITWRVWQSAR